MEQKPASPLASEGEISRVLKDIPQQKPFRFIDRILELSEDYIVAEYTFLPDEYFYRGHFPNHPVTPGVILLETMAQTGLVALGLYLLGKDEQAASMKTLFTECNAEFLQSVPPGSCVTVTGEKQFWRRRKLQSLVELKLEDGTLAAHGTIAGVGVPII